MGSNASPLQQGLASALGLAWAILAVLAALLGRAFAPYEFLYLPFSWVLELAEPTAAELRGTGELWNLVAAGCIPPLAYLVLGLLLLRGLRVPARGVERLALSWLLGTGAASLLLMGLRLFDIPVPLIILAVASVAGLAFEWRAWRAEHRGAVAPERSRVAVTVDAAALVTGGFLVLAALGPEVAWDALEYHLPIAKAWSEGPIRSLPGVFDAELRAGVDLLYIPAMAAEVPDAAAVVTACFALALAALVRAEAARSLSPVTAAWCGLLTLLTPLVLTHAPTCYTDLAVGAYGFGSLLAAHHWNRSGDRYLMVLAAIFAAFAANAKLHAAVLIPAIFVLLLIGGRPPRQRSLLRLVGLVIVLTLPWFVKAGMSTGNPFFPLLGEFFGWGQSDAAHVAIRRQRLALDLPPELRSLPSYLYHLAFGDHPYLGSLLGPLPLAFAPLALRCMDRTTATLTAVWVGLFALQFTFAPSLRFGTPLLPFVALVAANGAESLARRGRRVGIAVGLLCAGVAAFQAASAVGAYAPRLGALRAPGPYERAVWPAEESLRKMVARAEPVVAIPMGAVLWMPKPVYLLIGERNGEIFVGRDSPRHVFDVFERRGVRSLVVSVKSPIPADGRLDHPIFGEWIRQGWLQPRDDVQPLPAFPGKVWVLLNVVPPRQSPADSRSPEGQ
jgi:hypothetical protein